MGRAHSEERWPALKYFFFIFLLAQSVLASGTYAQNCRVIGDDYLKFEIEIQKIDFVLKITAFEDEDCQVPYLIYNQYFEIDQIQNENLNLKTKKVTYTAFSEEVASALRMINYCGFSEWQVRSETEVTGKNCDGFIQLAHGQIFYQLLKLENKVLKFGLTDENRDGRSFQNRPVQFDDAEYLLR